MYNVLNYKTNGAPGSRAGIKTFQVKAADLPVLPVIESDPAACAFKIAHIDVFDSGGAKVDTKPAINATTANVPPTLNALGAVDYIVFVTPSLAVNPRLAKPYNGGSGRIYENCAGKTLLYIANVSFPSPQFTLRTV